MPRIRSHNQNSLNDGSAFETNARRNPVDVHVGGRVRLLRISAGMSEDALRTALGVSAEKMQAYENGAARIGPSLLYQISKLLNCSPTVFFEDLELVNSAH